MKDRFTLTIPQPCHEKWSNFSKTKHGGFCSSCQKEVIDFTTWDEDRIKEYFVKHSNTCGRFRSNQLKEYTSTTPSWMPGPIFGIFLMFLANPSNALPPAAPPIHSERTLFPENDQHLQIDTIGVRVIKGTVRAASDTSLMPGVNVVLKGTSHTTVTDHEGKFTLSIPDGVYSDTIEFLFIGYVNSEINLSQTTSFDVVMHEDVVGFSYPVTAGGVCVRRFGLRNIWWRIRNIFR
ncbi:carboxypeptidase-like regulatory domain-containing protein [Ohtaekwangia sp.]|uniref:carboxypeptidase-like regulatory domain-containing protein n=1 Tax=Ohtaekwangia sp. TaxID=2066019 RepID=UPI002FDE1D0E